MSKHNYGRDVLVGYGLGYIFRMVFDRKKLKEEQREQEKREMYRAVYGKDAYFEKYIKPELEAKRAKQTEENYLWMEYEDQKKGEFVTFIFTLVFGSLGYLYVDTIAFGAGFMFNFFALMVGVKFMNFMDTNTPLDFMLMTTVIFALFVIIRLTHVVIACVITYRYNEDLKVELGINPPKEEIEEEKTDLKQQVEG